MSSPPRIPTAIPTAIATLAVAVLLLTGCSAGAGAPQTAKQACAVLETDLISSSSGLSSAFSTLQSDPQGAETALAKFSKALTSSADKVTNAQVKAAVTATTKSVDAMDVDLKDYVKDTSHTAKLESSATKVQTTFSKLGGLCTA